MTRLLLAIAAGAQLALSLALLPRPLLRFAGYFGGRQKDMVNGIAVDRNGYIYIVGQTDSPDFPSTPHALRRQSGVNNNDWVGFAAKLTPDAKRAVYSTFIGGSYRTIATALAVDQAGNAFVAGTTCSSDFLVSRGAFQAQAPGGGKGVEGCDAFVTKLDAGGSHDVYSTYLGGSAGDTATSLWVDSNGNAWVAGFTSSPDLPVSRDALEPHLKGERDGFLIELDPQGRHLLYGTYLGGAGEDSVQAIAGGADGILYLVGVSNSADFLNCKGCREVDGFVLPFSTARHSQAGEVLRLGGTAYSAALSVTTGMDGSVYVAGTTDAKDFRTTANAFQRRLTGSTDAFWARLRRDTKCGRLGLIYASLIGGSEDTSGDAIAVDRNGTVSLAGRTTSADFPITPTAWIPRLRRLEDGYLARFTPAGRRMEFGTFIGGGTRPTTWNVGVKGLATDESGNLYVAAFVNEPAFTGTRCALAARPAGNTEPLLLGLTFTRLQTATAH